jgi:hypothetical protein
MRAVTFRLLFQPAGHPVFVAETGILCIPRMRNTRSIFPQGMPMEILAF